MAESKATLSIDVKAVADLPILSGTAGLDVIDIRTLGSHGYFTYDPGFLATASCESAITFIDGGKGVLQHRGYAIDDLAKKADYLEVCYILLNGDAPTKSQYDEFKSIITNHTMVHEKLVHFFQGLKLLLHDVLVNPIPILIFHSFKDRFYLSRVIKFDGYSV